MASRQALRRAWWQVHKYVGLSLLLLLMPLGLSGAVLTWDDAIDHALNPQRYAVHGAATLPPSAYAAAAARALAPGDRIVAIRYPGGEGPVVVTLSLSASPAGSPARGGEPRARPQRATLWLDPADGRRLDEARGDSGLVRLAHDFHGSLFVPGIGRTLIGLLGVAMAVMAVAGLWLWCPPVGRIARGLRWRRGDRRLDTNLHHRVGFWIALPLAFQAFTGVWIAWPQMMTTIGLAPQRIGMMERMRMVPVEHAALGPNGVLAKAQAADPGVLGAILWPTAAGGAWHVSLATATGQADVAVDDATGVATIAPRRGGLGPAMRHLHDGTTLGIGWRVAMVLWGLAPTLLGITGLLMWWRGRRWRATVAQRMAKVRAA